MRTAVAVLGLFTFAAGAAASAAADERVASDKVTIQRIMALAEQDLNLRRAELGMIGSALPAMPVAMPPLAASGVDRVNRVDGVVAKPAPVTSPTIEAVPAVSSQN